MVFQWNGELTYYLHEWFWLNVMDERTTKRHKWCIVRTFVWNILRRIPWKKSYLTIWFRRYDFLLGTRLYSDRLALTVSNVIYTWLQLYRYIWWSRFNRRDIVPSIQSTIIIFNLKFNSIVLRYNFCDLVSHRSGCIVKHRIETVIDQQCRLSFIPPPAHIVVMIPTAAT